MSRVEVDEEEAIVAFASVEVGGGTQQSLNRSSTARATRATALAHHHDIHRSTPRSPPRLI